MEINLDQYKQLCQYYIEKEAKPTRKPKAESKDYGSAQSQKLFPQDLCDKLITEVKSEVDKDFDTARYKKWFTTSKRKILYQKHK